MSKELEQVIKEQIVEFFSLLELGESISFDSLPGSGRQVIVLRNKNYAEIIHGIDNVAKFFARRAKRKE